MQQQFDWHPPKAEANFRKHGVTFDQGIKAIGDVFAVGWIDDRENHGEDRMNVLGMCGGLLLHVTYTERDERIRIISVRRAKRNEYDYYFRENAT